ncbi:manganese transporter [filamentous cyanobacterium CCP5]|nr:manganese transporter [filamentous cyanobacterium CCP5]
MYTQKKPQAESIVQEKWWSVTRRAIGPAAIISAAFVGPGTITTASVAGISYQYALLWTLPVAGIMSFLFMDQTARIGIVAKKTLQEALHDLTKGTIWRWPVAILVIAAIGIGNCAFVIGNITGAALGMQGVVGGPIPLWTVITGVVSIAFLLAGSYKLLERVLTGFVVVMSAVFLITAIAIRPDLGALFQGAVLPVIPPDSFPIVIGLVGTTISSYQFFLHSSAAKEHWSTESDLKLARIDYFVSVSLGILISMAIVVTAAALYGTNLTISYGARELAEQLRPTLGNYAPILFSVGLFAASISSAIPTALATGWVFTGILGLNTRLTSLPCRVVMVAFIFVATYFATIGERPLSMILFAQMTNGLLLPIAAVAVLFVANKRDLLGSYVNKLWLNLASGALVLLTLYLGFRSLKDVFSTLLGG